MSVACRVSFCTSACMSLLVCLYLFLYLLDCLSSCRIACLSLLVCLYLFLYLLDCLSSCRIATAIAPQFQKTCPLWSQTADCCRICRLVMLQHTHRNYVQNETMKIIYCHSSAKLCPVLQDMRCVCVCVCVCVCARARARVRESVCVCVCVCV